MMVSTVHMVPHTAFTLQRSLMSTMNDNKVNKTALFRFLVTHYKKKQWCLINFVNLEDLIKQGLVHHSSSWI